MKVKGYFARRTYSWQITCRAIINIQVGYTVFGVALMPKSDPFKRRWWTKIFPLLNICVNKHSGQCGQIIRFRLQVFGYGFQYKSRGETYPGHYRWNEVGLHMMRRLSNV